MNARAHLVRGMLGWLLVAVAAASCGDGVNRDCTRDDECMVLSDCCVGCTAARVGETLETCEEACPQNACALTYGSTDVVAICQDGTCSVQESPGT